MERTTITGPVLVVEDDRNIAALVAEIMGVDLSRPLDTRTYEAVHRAFLDHQVIFFRDQDITPDQHKDFARRFGPLNVHPYVKALDGHPEILEVLKDTGDSRNFGGLWHIDLTFMEEPPLRGTPEVIIERLNQLQERGINHIFGSFGFPGLPQEKVLRSIEMVATQVMPHFQEVPVS